MSSHLKDHVVTDGSTQYTDLPEPVLLKIAHFVGPKYTCLSIGSTCRALRDLSSSDFLWTQFWKDRCCRPDDHRGGNLWKEENGGDPPTENVREKYIEMHGRVLPKPTKKVADVLDERGQIVETARGPVDCSYQIRSCNASRWHRCRGTASIWCDFEDCGEARCRCRDCPEKIFEERMKFIKCSFCKMTACESHATKYDWPKPCSLCKVASCNHCISETLVSRTRLRCQHLDGFLRVQCDETICANCSDVVCVRKTGDYEVEVTTATKDEIFKAAREANDAKEEGGYEEWVKHIKHRICRKECGEKIVSGLKKKRDHHFRLEDERLEQFNFLKPTPRYTKRALNQSCNEKIRSIRWAFGTFSIVHTDNKMRGGKLVLGVNEAEFITGYIMLPKMESDGEISDIAVDENEVKTFDFVGLGTAWESDDLNFKDHQPKLIEGKDHCIEITGEAAPGPNYSFCGHTHIGANSILRIEKVTQGEHDNLKCNLIVRSDCCRCQISFTCIPESSSSSFATKIETVSSHDLKETRAAKKKSKNNGSKVKAKRRK